MNRFDKIVRTPGKYFRLFLVTILSKFYFIPDKPYLKVVYWLMMNRKLNLDNPRTFNEKIQWLKLYDRKPEYTMMVDKAAVKEYVAHIIGEEHIIPTIGVYNNFDEIDFEKLPDQFVMKCTHDSGGSVICTDKSKLNFIAAKKRINFYLRRKYFYCWREWPYRNVKPQVIVEKYIEDEGESELKDFKFFCFNGEVKALFIATDRNKPGLETKFDFFDPHFNHLPIINGHPNMDTTLEKPANFKEMIELAAKLSMNMAYVRVDLYNVKGKIYFGEFTLSHFTGMIPFEPEDWDYTFGSWIQLPKI